MLGFCSDLITLKEVHMHTVCAVFYGEGTGIPWPHNDSRLISPAVGKHLFLCNSKRFLNIQDFRNSKGTCFQTPFMRH